MVASPRKKKKPATSVTVARKIPEASAGSIFTYFKDRGIRTPASSRRSPKLLHRRDEVAEFGVDVGAIRDRLGDGGA